MWAQPTSTKRNSFGFALISYNSVSSSTWVELFERGINKILVKRWVQLIPPVIPLTLSNWKDKLCIWEHLPNASWAPTGLGPWPLSWGACSSAWLPSGWRTFSNLDLSCSSFELGSCHWSLESRDQHLPLRSPLWGSWIKLMQHKMELSFFLWGIRSII